MRKQLLGGLTSLLIPLATYGAHTAYGTYQRRPSAQVAGFQPLPPINQHRLPVDRSSITGEDQLDLIAANNELSIAAGAQARELVIIDAAVPDKAVLQSAARPGVDVFILKAGEDALEQTATLLKNYRNLDAVHLVSHGESGAILLGNHRIDKTNLEAQPGFLAALNAATRSGADLLLYGCDLAKDDGELLELIQQNSHLDIAASNNLTGAAELDGDWTLEIAAGNIETSQPFSSKALRDFSAVLRPFGTESFYGTNGAGRYEDDPSVDWGSFTTYINTPGDSPELLDRQPASAVQSCGNFLRVEMYYAGSRFFVRSKPAGQPFGLTGLTMLGPEEKVSDPGEYEGHPANELTITGYDAGGNVVGEKGPIATPPMTSTEGTSFDIDLTSGITGSFVNVMRFRVDGNHFDHTEIRDFCLQAIHFTNADQDGAVNAGAITTPVSLGTTVDTAAEAVDVLDFTLSDGGSSDVAPLKIPKITVNVSGTATDAERNRITWRLNRPDAGNVTGSYDAGTDTLTFSGLNISVADGGSSDVYTIDAWYNDNSGLSDGHTIQLSLDGGGLTTDPGGSRGDVSTSVSNDVTLDVTATKLAFTTQPAGSVSGTSLTTQPVVEAQDAAGNIDTDFNHTITLTEDSVGSLSNNTLSATGGIATFTNLIYSASADNESFTLTANGGSLPAAVADPLTSDVVATQLTFLAQPAPTTVTSNLPTALTVIPVVAAVDANGDVDSDYSTDIILAEVNGAGSANISASGDTDGDSTTATVTPNNGVSTFTGMNITYLSGGGDETFNLRAVSGALTADSAGFTANQPPTDITLDSDSVNYSDGVNGVVGSLDTADLDTLNSHSYSLVTGSGDTDNGSFNISGNQLRVDDAESLAPGSYTVRIQTEDNHGRTFQESFTITVVDDIAPTVSSVDALSANGTYVAGDNLDFSVNTSENVTVYGLPPTRIPLTFDSGTVYAEFIGGSNSPALTYRYTVQAGDNDADGIEVGAAIQLSGEAAIKDSAGNDLVPDLNNVATTTGVRVDAVAPDAPSTPDLAAASDTGASATDNITADTTPTLTGSAEPNSTVTLVSNADGTLGTTAADGSGNWSFTPGAALSEGSHSITATATDAVGHTSTASAGLSLTLDTTAPAVPSVPDLVAAFDSGSSDSDDITSETTPTLSGTAEADSLVTIVSSEDGELGTTTADGSGNWSFTPGTPLSGGSHGLAVFATDAAGNESAASSALSITLDDQAPSLDWLNLPPAATYTDDQNLEFAVHYDEAVTVTGTPRLALTIGASTRYATYVSGSGSPALLFRYTVQAGDNDGDGIALDTTLDAAGGTLRDIAGNNANFNLGTIGDLQSVRVDTQGPSVDALTLPANASYIAGQNLEFAVHYNDTVIANTSGGIPRLALTIGAITRYAPYVSGSGSPTLLFRYTVQAGDNDNDGITLSPTLHTNSGILQDEYGNPTDNNLGTIGSLASVLVDTQAPIIDSVSVPANATYIAGDNLIFTVNTSEKVTGTGTPRIPLTLGGATVYAEFTGGSGTSALTFRYRVQEGDSDTDGIGVASVIELNAGTLMDASGNPLVTGLNSVGATTGVRVDAVAPDAPPPPELDTASDSGASSNDNITMVTTPTLTGTAEAHSTVRVMSDIDGTLGTAAADGSGNWSFTSSVALSENVHSITVTATDVNGNTSAASGPLSLIIDTTAPATPMAPVLAATSDLGNSNSDNITSDTTPTLIGTAEAGSALAVISAIDGALGTTAVDGSGGWSFTPGTALSDNTHNLTVLATDPAGNQSTASSALSVTVDSEASSVSSVSLPANATYFAGQNLDFTIKYDQAVTVTGALRLELTVGASTRYATYISGTGSNTLLFRHTVQSGDNDTDGIALSPTLDTNGGVLRDAAGNDANIHLGAIGSLASVRVDTQPPLVDSVSVPASGTYITGETLGFTVNTSEDVVVTGTPRIPLTLGSSTVYALYTGGTGTAALVFQYTVQAGDSDPDGIEVAGILDTNDGTLRDNVGNGLDTALSSVGATNAVLVDTIAPSNHSVRFSDSAINSTEASAIGFTFTDAEVGADYAYTIDSSGGGTLVTATGTIAGSGESIGGIDVSGLPDGTITLSVTLTDSAGNAASAVTDTATLDVSAPNGHGISFTESAIGAAEAGNISFTFTGAETGASYDYTISGSDGGTSVTGSGTVSSAAMQVTGIDVSGQPDGTLTLSVVLTDAIGNAAGAVTDTATLDTAGPIPSITTAADDPTNGAFTAAIGFGEAVRNFVIGDITAGNASLSGLADNGDGHFSVTVTPINDGAVTLNVAANIAQDMAGNANVAATELSIDFDGTAPAPVISSEESDPTYNTSFPVTIEFGETVSEFAIGDITAGNASLSDFTDNSEGNFSVTVTPTADGTVTLDVAANVARDAANNGSSVASQFSVEFLANAIPIADDDLANTTEDHAVIFNVLGNDSDANDAINPASVKIINAPGNGRASVHTGTGFVTYTPNADFTGSDTFTYTVQDTVGADSNAATVSVTVSATNDAPAAVADLASTTMNTSVSIDVAANDSDMDTGDNVNSATIVFVQHPANGSISLNAGQVDYQPNADFTGSDRFRYTIEDENGAVSNAALVVINITGSNNLPTAADDTAITNEDNAVDIDVLANDRDPDGSLVAATVQLMREPQHGSTNVDGDTGSITYTPAADYTGSDRFTYLIQDGAGGSSNIATVDITVNEVNDAPVALGDIAVVNSEPVAINVLGNDRDAENGIVPATVQVVSAAGAGTTSVNSDGSITYTPTSFSGSDSFTYRVRDVDSAWSDPATVTLTDAMPNLPPLANNDQGVTEEDNAVTLSVLSNDADIDGTLVVGNATIVDAPSLGSARVGGDGTITYTPDGNINGSDSFTYTIEDNVGAVSNIATVTLRITAVNDVPTIGGTPESSVVAGFPYTFTPTLVDLEGDGLTVTASNLPTWASLDGATGTVSGTPTNTHAGTAANIVLSVSDGRESSALAAFAIEVLPDTDRDGTEDAVDTDDDGDGLPDAVEEELGLAPLDPDDAAGDLDEDGVSNLDEYLAGTDPTDPKDYLDTTPPEITVPADLLIDATGLYTPVTLRQLLALPANATGEEVQSALDALASDNIDGAGCCGTNAATIASNGGAAQAINGDLSWLAPGAHVIIWQAQDSKGNVSAVPQAIRIRPLLGMQKDQVGAEGGAVTLRLHLNGLSDIYPLQVPYSIDASSIADSADHDLVDGNVTFTAGQIQQSVTVNLTDGDAVEGDETLVVGLDTSAVNPGARATHTITITENNVPPAVALDLQQSAVNTTLVVSTDDEVTVTANVSDPNTADTHSYDWSENARLWGDIDGDTLDDTLVFDPATLDPGVYTIRATVTDNDGAANTATLNFRVVAQAPALDSNTDSDGDGIDDLSEGFGDTDGDGIPDYRDNIAASNVLPLTADTTDAYLLECDPGVLCRLGSHALAGDNGATIARDALPEEQDFNFIGNLFDFEVHDLPIAGQTTRVVIPLSEAIPADAVYRKFDGQQWFTFIEDAHNVLHSSAGAAGFCPPPGSAAWESGLTQGHYCVQLTLEDGGPNDSDGLANGSVPDSGGIAVPVLSGGGDDGGTDGEQPIPQPVEGKSSGGGAFGLLLLLPLLLLALWRNRGLALPLRPEPRHNLAIKAIDK